MKTSVVEVHDMPSVLSVDEVEKRIGEVPGVESVTVNFAAGNATTRYDETRPAIAMQHDMGDGGKRRGKRWLWTAACCLTIIALISRGYRGTRPR